MKALLTAGLMLMATPCLVQPSFAQQSVPQIPFDSVADFPKLPDGMNFGEVPGVAVNSKGHVFVFTRSNSANGPAYAPTAAQLLEFTAEGDFVREIGKGLYAWAFAHSVRIDKDDNIWAIDKGSDMIVKFNPARSRPMGVRPSQGIRRRRQAVGTRQPTVAADRRSVPRADRCRLGFQGQHLHQDGYINSRVAKFDAHGKWVKSWGEPGTEPGSVSLAARPSPSTITTSLCGRPHQSPHPGVRHRRQVPADVRHHGAPGHDDAGPSTAPHQPATVLTQVIGAPNSICITPGPTR